MAETVLVLAPHPDDEAIGCGGTICLHHERGEPVRVVFLTSGERAISGVAPETVRTMREEEANAAADILGTLGIDFLRLPDLALAENVEPGGRVLAELLEAHAPGIIYLPHPAESHPDHAASFPLVCAALALVPRDYRPELRGYEVWTPMARYDWPEDITPVMTRKLRAIRCYRSQLQAFRYDRAVRGLNQFRGCLAARCRYAEVFQSLDPTMGESHEPG
jgi:LmbE family N-acetylglucosaminyl deacetylase